MVIKVQIWHDEGIEPEIDMKVLHEIYLPAVPRVGDKIDVVGDHLPVKEVVWDIDELSGLFTHVNIFID